MSLTTLQSLTTQSGISGLRRALSNVRNQYHTGDEAAPSLKNIIQQELQENPQLADVKLNVIPGFTGGYFPQEDALGLGIINPAVLAHELAHVKNLRKSKVYGKILDVANNVARLNNRAALPAMLAIRALVQDKETRREILNILSGLSAVVSAPALAEEFSASMEALKSAPDKAQAAQTLLPAFLQHALAASKPLGIYQLGKHI